MEPKDLKIYCYYCQDNEATHTRDIPLRRQNGYKLMDFEVKLCDRCNGLNDQVLSNYFSV